MSAELRAAIKALADEWESTPKFVKGYMLDRAHGARLRAILDQHPATSGEARVERREAPIYDREACEAAFACIPRSCPHWRYETQTRLVTEWEAADE